MTWRGLVRGVRSNEEAAVARGGGLDPGPGLAQLRGRLHRGAGRQEVQAALRL